MSDDVEGTARGDRGKGPSQPLNRSRDQCSKTQQREGADTGKEGPTRDAVPHDPVNHPAHYNQLPAFCSYCGGRIECIDVVEQLNFCLGNAIKYIWRADLKNGLEDLEKGRWYLDREIERLKAKELMG